MPIDLATEMRLGFLRYLEEVVEGGRHQARRRYRDYYDGLHDTLLTARMRAFLQVEPDKNFRLNAMPIVVDALSEKLSVAGFACAEQAETFQSWWDANRLDAKQGVVHLSAVRDGDAYVLVEWDDLHDRPVITRQAAYDGDEGFELYYQDSKPLVAVKRWRVETGPDAGNVFRANLYFPDRIERRQQRGTGQWELLSEEDWTVDGEPIGIPVAHFKNRDQGYNYGQSELDDPIPLQDAMNKSLIDLLAAADVAGFGMPYMIGDDPSALTVAPGQWVFTTRPPGGENGASIGKLPADDLEQLISVVDSFMLHIARITRTPTSMFQVSGNSPAEGTLKEQSSGLIAKVRNRQVDFGNAWEDVMSIARRLYNAFGKGGLDEDETISTLWVDPESRNEVEHLTGLKLKRETLEIPLETLWAEAGYDAIAIERMQEERAREAAAGVGSLASGLLDRQRQFDQGSAPVVG